MEKLLINRLLTRPASTFRRAGRSTAASMGAVMLLCALAAVSCSKEIIDEQPGGPASDQMCSVPITLTAGLETEIDVKSVDGLDENAITNVWVLQLSEDGSQQLAAPQYLDELQAIGDGKRIYPELALQPSQLIFLANTWNPELLPTTGNTLASVSALSYSVTNEESILSNGVNIPTFALWTGTPSALGIPLIELKRVVAKLNLNVTARLTEGFTFHLETIKICNTAKKVHYFYGTDGNSPLTSIDDIQTGAIETQEVNQTLTAETPVVYSHLLPVNRRGTGTGTKPIEKDAAHAPDGQADYCTYVELSGEYRGENSYACKCEFRIYLGENLSNDYNVTAGRQYNLNVTITGVNSMDMNLTDIVEQYKGDNLTDRRARWTWTHETPSTETDMIKSLAARCVYVDEWEYYPVVRVIEQYGTLSYYGYRCNKSTKTFDEFGVIITGTYHEGRGDAAEGEILDDNVDLSPAFGNRNFNAAEEFTYGGVLYTAMNRWAYKTGRDLYLKHGGKVYKNSDEMRAEFGNDTKKMRYTKVTVMVRKGNKSATGTARWWEAYMNGGMWRTYLWEDGGLQELLGGGTDNSISLVEIRRK